MSVSAAACYLDEESAGRGLDWLVERALLREAGSITSPSARRTVLSGRKEIGKTLDIWRNRGVSCEAQNVARAMGLNRRNSLFALQPVELSESEASELDAFRARRSRIEGMTFQRVPTQQ